MIGDPETTQRRRKSLLDQLIKENVDNMLSKNVGKGNKASLKKFG